MSESRKQKLLSNPTRAYHPGSYGWYGYPSSVIDGAPWFTWFDVPRMLRDPQVRFILKMWRAPFQQVTWKVKAESDRVAKFVDMSLRRLWRRHLPMILLRYCCYGYAAGGVEFALQRGLIRANKLQVVEPRDARPLVWSDGPNKGERAGFSANSLKVLAPHAVWFAGNEEMGEGYDWPILAGMFEPWLEKRGRGGAIHSRRLWYRKCAFTGGTMYHPPGPINVGTDEAPQIRDSQDVARETLEMYESGGILTFSNEQHPGIPGKYSWEFTPSESRADVAGVRDYPKDLDQEMLRGAGIPPEVLEASQVGSGWSGRMIPLLAYYGGVDEFVGPLIEALSLPIRHAAHVNFGASWFGVEPIPLTEMLKQQAEAGPGGKEGENPLAGLFGDSKPEQKSKPVSMSDGRGIDRKKKRNAIGLILSAMLDLQTQATRSGKPESASAAMNRLGELAGSPDELESILGGIQLAWSPYKGPRGGKGWINDTGRIVYGAGKPGEKREKARASASAARAVLAKVWNLEATPEDMASLADHLPALTTKQLREVRYHLKATFGGGRNRQQMVNALLAHVRGEKPEKIERPAKKAGSQNAGTAKREDGTPANTRMEDVHTVPVESLNRDPSRFQYKVSGIGKDGVTDELKGVGKYNHELGGTLLVWRDPENGKDYVVNGHHRHELAERSKSGTVNARYIDAPNAKVARAKGALANIAEGRGTAVDAAKYIRDTGSTAEDLREAGISLSGKVAADAMTLKDLGDKAFQDLTEGKLDEQKAVAVARHLKDPALQDMLFRKLRSREEEGKDWSKAEIETAARKMANAGKYTEKGADLFGDFEEEHSTFDQEVELESYVGRMLAQRANDFAAVSNAKRADRVSDAGNVLAVEENQKRRQQADQNLETFNLLVNRSGPISKAIQKSAVELASAKTKKEKDRVKERALGLVQTALEGDLGFSGTTPVAADTGGTVGSEPGRSEDPGPEPVANEPEQPAGVAEPTPEPVRNPEDPRRKELIASNRKRTSQNLPSRTYHPDEALESAQEAWKTGGKVNPAILQDYPELRSQAVYDAVESAAFNVDTGDGRELKPHELDSYLAGKKPGSDDYRRAVRDIGRQLVGSLDAMRKSGKATPEEMKTVENIIMDRVPGAVQIGDTSAGEIPFKGEKHIGGEGLFTGDKVTVDHKGWEIDEGDGNRHVLIKAKVSPAGAKPAKTDVKPEVSTQPDPHHEFASNAKEGARHHIEASRAAQALLSPEERAHFASRINEVDHKAPDANSKIERIIQEANKLMSDRSRAEAGKNQENIRAAESRKSSVMEMVGDKDGIAKYLNDSDRKEFSDAANSVDMNSPDATEKLEAIAKNIRDRSMSRRREGAAASAPPSPPVVPPPPPQATSPTPAPIDDGEPKLGLINERWFDQNFERWKHIADPVEREAKKREYEEAQEQHERTLKALRGSGFIRNQYGFKNKNGDYIQANRGWVRRNPDTGRYETFTNTDAISWIRENRKRDGSPAASGGGSTPPPPPPVLPSPEPPPPPPPHRPMTADEISSRYRDYREGETRPEPPFGYKWAEAIEEIPSNDGRGGTREYGKVYKLIKSQDNPDKVFKNWHAKAAPVSEEKTSIPPDGAVGLKPHLDQMIQPGDKVFIRRMPLGGRSEGAFIVRGNSLISAYYRGQDSYGSSPATMTVTTLHPPPDVLDAVQSLSSVTPYSPR